MKLRIKNYELRRPSTGSVGALPHSQFKIQNSKFSRAFTLIEMILAIGVAAIVLVAITSVLFAALRLHDATADVVNSATPLDQTTIFLRRDLQCLVTPTNGTSKVLSGDFKIGNVSTPGMSETVAAEIFTATGALSASSPWGDIQRVTYELKNAADAASPGKDLYRTVTRNLLATSTQDLDDQLMLTGVTDIKFSAYDGTRWLDAWDTSDATALNTNLPLAVRVEIQLAGNNSDPIQIVVPVDSVSRTNAVIQVAVADNSGGGDNGGNNNGGSGGGFGGGNGGGGRGGNNGGPGGNGGNGGGRNGGQ